jgi:hypothetical protein
VLLVGWQSLRVYPHPCLTVTLRCRLKGARMRMCVRASPTQSLTISRLSWRRHCTGSTSVLPPAATPPHAPLLLLTPGPPLPFTPAGVAVGGEPPPAAPAAVVVEVGGREAPASPCNPASAATWRITPRKAIASCTTQRRTHIEEHEAHLAQCAITPRPPPT